MFTHTLRRLAWKFGYDIRRAPSLRYDSTGVSAIDDITWHLGTSPRIVFDVGANTGQTLGEVWKWWPAAIVHCFEPDSRAFSILSETVANAKSGAVLNNFALGSSQGKATFYHYNNSVQSSMLKPGAAPYGSVEAQTVVDTVTLDDYCANRNIAEIDLLKTDCQGFDLHVLQGATRILRTTRLVLSELIVADEYAGQAEWTSIVKFLTENGFQMVSMYDFEFRNGRLAFMNGLFVRD